MIRDLTMIFAVLVSAVSVIFGVYKNIEAGNAKAFAYEQAYRIMGVVRDAQISAPAKADILDAALNALATPEPVIDLSRSSAGTLEPEICTDAQKAVCAEVAGTLADDNTLCTQSKGTDPACSRIADDKSQIDAQGCVACFSR